MCKRHIVFYRTVSQSGNVVFAIYTVNLLTSKQSWFVTYSGRNWFASLLGGRDPSRSVVLGLSVTFEAGLLITLHSRA